MFIGREKELATLNGLYNSDKFEFAVIYGRRRVGKTALISHFIQDKKAIYFMGVESNEKQNLENFSQAIMEYASGIMPGTSFMSFQAAIEYVFKLCENERLVLVIDEYPYVAKASKSMASTLQMLIDKNKDNSKMMLILCGSSMSYMEDNVLAYKAPLYGRRTAQMKILPFDFEDSCKYFNGFSAEDMALIYGIVGGTPQYLLQMNDSMSVEDNIKNVFLNPASAIFEEPENLLKQEVREPAVYNAIITAVAIGSSRMSEIATKIGETTSVCSQYMKNLINLGLIRKEMGRIFEEICMQYLWKLLINGEAPVEFNDLGRWWGTDPQERIQTEIDIMGDQDKSTALFGECKWINENVDVKVLEKLKKRSTLFRYENVHLFLFAKKGFTQGCIEEAGKMGNVSLVTYDQIYGYFK